MWVWRVATVEVEEGQDNLVTVGHERAQGRRRVVREECVSLSLQGCARMCLVRCIHTARAVLSYADPTSSTSLLCAYSSVLSLQQKHFKRVAKEKGEDPEGTSSKGSARRVRQCRRCRGHKEFVDAKGHALCPYAKCKCVICTTKTRLGPGPRPGRTASGSGSANKRGAKKGGGAPGKRSRGAATLESGVFKLKRGLKLEEDAAGAAGEEGESGPLASFSSPGGEQGPEIMTSEELMAWLDDNDVTHDIKEPVGTTSNGAGGVCGGGGEGGKQRSIVL